MLCAFAGGRRTDTAYRRFARRRLAADVEVYPPLGAGLVKLNFDEIGRLPQVLVATTLNFVESDGPHSAVPTGAYWRSVNVPKILSGRLPRSDRADEVAITYTFARHRHLSVGSRLVVRFRGSGATGQTILPVQFRVVGIEAGPGDFPPFLEGSYLLQVAMTPAFLATYQHQLGPPHPVLVVRLRHGDADVGAFEAGLRGLAAGRPQLHTLPSAQAAGVQRGFHLQALALWLLGGFLAMVSLLVLSQMLAREIALDSQDGRTLTALGMTRRAVWLVALAPAVTVAVVGAVLAAAVAVAASPLLPVGTARLAEPDPGLAVDWLVVGVGATLMAVVIVAVAAWPAWRTASRAVAAAQDPGFSRSSLFSRVVASGVLSPAGSVGIGTALQPGRGRTAVPVRSSVAALVVAVAAVATAVTFGASLSHLVATPALYGLTWDARVVTPTNNDLTNTVGNDFETVLSTLGSDRRVEAIAAVGSLPLLVGDKSVNGLSFTTLKGDITPVLLHGREPRSSDEIALGAKTMRDLHLQLGKTVSVSISVLPLVRAPKRVVGVVVSPPGDNATRIGAGARMTFDGLQSLIPPGNPLRQPEGVFRLASGVDKERTITELRHRIGAQAAVSTPQPPDDLVNLRHARNLPLVLVGILTLLAVATLAYTLITSVTRRARDLALLKTLGFVPSQVRRVVGWQSTAFIAAALLLGLPIGIAGGRLLWDAFATQLGARPEPVTPLLPLLLTVPAALIVANLVASIPGFVASLTPPALALRTE
ncbi:MAG: hypothetical protein NVS3B21_34320 [Acidimicrobiales bacterium]